jgi:hypothetical protein
MFVLLELATCSRDASTGVSRSKVNEYCTTIYRYKPLTTQCHSRISNPLIPIAILYTPLLSRKRRVRISNLRRQVMVLRELEVLKRKNLSAREMKSLRQRDRELPELARILISLVLDLIDNRIDIRKEVLEPVHIGRL